ncbi:MAG: hypothetical protein LW832_02220 [Parachlamydia sp.]|jgi:hypothetical protein|nr:hypothetical protein [Parachlamydia sp.]
MRYNWCLELSLTKYRNEIKFSGGSLTENDIRKILVSCGFPAYPRPISLVGEWKIKPSIQYPAIQYWNDKNPGLNEWVAILPHDRYGFKPHILHFSSGVQSFISTEHVNFYHWFEYMYPKLEYLRKEIDFNDKTKVGTNLYEMLECQILDLVKVSFLNTFFGNYSIFKQIMKDIDLCLNCFKPGLPKSGLGITRFYNNFMIRHMQGKKWASHKNQQCDYVILNKNGKFAKLTNEREISFTNNKKDPDVHIPLEKYNREDFCLGHEVCLCSKKI